MKKSIEASYPLYFREKDIKTLSESIKRGQSIELIGIKRVGINNFLRFFLFNNKIKETYAKKNEENISVLVDINDLIELELFPFWTLVLKRIADAIEVSNVEDEIKEKIAEIFTQTVQLKDFFLTYDAVKEVLVIISEVATATVFFTRFDRLSTIATPEFFSNLESLRESTHEKLSYVFTSYREIDQISSFMFSAVEYIKPALDQDTDVLLVSFLEKYDLKLDRQFIDFIIDMSGGHAQYLQLLLILLDEEIKSKKTISINEYFDLIKNDERIMLLSEEIWESLSYVEKETLRKIIIKKPIEKEEKEQSIYLWNAGVIFEENQNIKVFSPLLKEYILKKEIQIDEKNIDFTKKENDLLSFLKEHLEEICDREKIIIRVWPEYKDYGVSDWSIDRLIARLRAKLKKQKSPFEIVTVRTRGYKLINKK